jgi:large conductance mechanosensitive channel
MFIIVKDVNAATKKKEKPAPAPPKGHSQEDLLAEIRDLLAKNK